MHFESKDKAQEMYEKVMEYRSGNGAFSSISNKPKIFQSKKEKIDDQVRALTDSIDRVNYERNTSKGSYKF